MAIVTGIPIGTLKTQQGIYLDSAPSFFFGGVILNNPDPYGYYWGLSGSSSNPVYEPGCYTDFAFTESAKSEVIQGEHAGVAASMESRDYLEITFTLNSFLPLDVLAKALRTGAARYGPNDLTWRSGVGEKVDKNHYFPAFWQKSYDEVSGAYFGFHAHRCQFVDAWEIGMPYAGVWAISLVLRVYADQTKPVGQEFGSFIWYDPNISTEEGVSTIPTHVTVVPLPASAVGSTVAGGVSLSNMLLSPAAASAVGSTAGPTVRVTGTYVIQAAEAFAKTLPPNVIVGGGAPPPQYNYYWWTSFEDPNFAEFDGVYGDITANGTGLLSGAYTLVTSPAKEGAHSVRVTLSSLDNSGGMEAVRFMRWGPEIAAHTSGAYYSCWFFWPQRYSGMDWWNIFQFKSNNGVTDDPVWTVNVGNMPDGAMRLYIWHNLLAAGYDQFTVTIPENQWVHLEAYVVLSTTNGRIALYQDGVQLFDLQNIQTRRTNDSVYWSVNNYLALVNGGTTTLYMDKMVMSPESTWNETPPTPTGTAIYYVDWTGGLDSNDGLTTGTPFKTLSKVGSMALDPGSRVNLRRGQTWEETLTVPSHGQYGSPITFGAYGSGVDPIINGANVITGMVLDAGYVYRKAGFAEVGPSQATYQDGVRLTKAASRGGMVAGSWFWDSADGSLYVWCTDNANPSTKTIEFTRRLSCVDLNGKSYVAFENIKVTKSALSGFSLRTNGSHHVTFNNCVAELCQYRGFDMGLGGAGKDYVVFTGCTAYNNNGEGFWVGYGAYSGLVDCALIANGRDRALKGYTYGDGGGVTLGVGSVQNYVRSSYFSGTYMGNDIFTYMEGVGPRPSGCIIDANTILHWADGGPGYNGRASNQATIYLQGDYDLVTNNILRDSTSNGILLDGGASHPRVYNNTSYWEGGGQGLKAYQVTYVDLRNNIIATMDALSGGCVSIGSTAAPNFISRNNVFYHSDGAMENRFDSTYYTDIAAWKTAAGDSTNTTGADPLLTGLADFTFLPGDGSPALDTGEDLVAVPFDHNGTPRPWGPATDKGAVEATTTNTTINVSDALALADLIPSIYVGPSQGTTYYITNDGGNDANDGLSTGTAWSSVDKISSMTFSPGDQILIKGGFPAHTGSFILTESGTFTNPITVGSWGPFGKAYIDATGRTNAVTLNGSYIRLDNLGLEEANVYGVEILGANCTLKNCSISGCSDGIRIAGANASVLSGYIHDNYRKVGDWNGGTAIVIYDGAHNFLVKENLIEANYCSGTYSMLGGGVDLWAGSATLLNGVIDSNRINYNMGGVGASGDSGGYISGIQVINNIFNNNYANDIGWKLAPSGTSYAAWGIYHNTFYHSNWQWRVFDMISGDFPDASRVLIKNNIFYSSTPIYDTGTVTHEYNHYYMTGGATVNTSLGNQEVEGSNPMFISLGSNFRLLSISPCINTGTSVGVTHDRDRITRPRGVGYDKGAHEFLE